MLVNFTSCKNFPSGRPPGGELFRPGMPMESNCWTRREDGQTMIRLWSPGSRRLLTRYLSSRTMAHQAPFAPTYPTMQLARLNECPYAAVRHLAPFVYVDAGWQVETPFHLRQPVGWLVQTIGWLCPCFDSTNSDSKWDKRRDWELFQIWSSALVSS